MSKVAGTFLAILIIFQKLNIKVQQWNLESDIPRFYNCTFDVCICCYNKKHMELSDVTFKETRQVKYLDSISYQMIDDYKYLKTGVRLTNDQLFNTVYKCPINSYYGYEKFHNTNYYPLLNSLKFQNLDINSFREFDLRFQMCIETYCYNDMNRINTNPSKLYIPNKLICIDNRIKDLKFRFLYSVTELCLQNITYAHIDSNAIVDLNESTFFSAALNVVYLDLRTNRALNRIKCQSFEKLLLLRFLNIYYVTRINAICIILHNKQLVKIKTLENYVWNTCKSQEMYSYNKMKRKIIRDNVVKYGANVTMYVQLHRGYDNEYTVCNSFITINQTQEITNLELKSKDMIEQNFEQFILVVWSWSLIHFGTPLIFLTIIISCNYLN